MYNNYDVCYYTLLNFLPQTKMGTETDATDDELESDFSQIRKNVTCENWAPDFFLINVRVD